MNGRLAKVVAMFNTLSDEDKEEVLASLIYPGPEEPLEAGFAPPEVETPYEVPNPSFAERYVEQ